MVCNPHSLLVALFGASDHSVASVYARFSCEKGCSVKCQENFLESAVSKTGYLRKMKDII